MVCPPLLFIILKAGKIAALNRGWRVGELDVGGWKLEVEPERSTCTNLLECWIVGELECSAICSVPLNKLLSDRGLLN